MNLPTSKAELIELIEREHAAIDGWIEPLDERQLTQLGVSVGWAGENITETGVAVKDVLVHLSLWEQRMLAYMALQLEDKPLADPRYSLTAPKFNARIYEENRNRSAAEVLREYRETYAAVLKTIHALDEDVILQLNANGLISYNTYNHYRWAVKKIRPWVRQQKKE